nr:hypothetical protein CFP56_63512 [Quercus suber]
MIDIPPPNSPCSSFHLILARPSLPFDILAFHYCRAIREKGEDSRRSVFEGGGDDVNERMRSRNEATGRRVYRLDSGRGMPTRDRGRKSVVVGAEGIFRELLEEDIAADGSSTDALEFIRMFRYCSTGDEHRHGHLRWGRNKKRLQVL